MELKAFWQIDITDNGLGFENTHNEKIFEIFQRLHGRSPFSGTGIGLAICKKIIINHQGFIYAHSEPSKGATFTIQLPI
jgi:signal transduction histidine kinase